MIVAPIGTRRARRAAGSVEVGCRQHHTHLVDEWGGRLPLEVDRWRADADDVERRLLSGLLDPVLDVGCGPGRIVAALAASGRPALGIDPSARAVAETVGRGGTALRRSVFAPLPAERRWGSVVLIDGNVGIGGDPIVLLRRVAELLAPGGLLLAEVEAPGQPTESLSVRLETRDRGVIGPWFRWARVGADGFAALARGAGLEPIDMVRHHDRWFGQARRPAASATSDEHTGLPR